MARSSRWWCRRWRARGWCACWAMPTRRSRCRSCRRCAPLAANSRVRIVETINDALDVDLYSLTANAGEVLGVSMSRLPFGQLSYVRVFDAAGTEVAADLGSGPNSAPLLHYRVATSGTYFVGASGWSNANYDPTGPNSGTQG